MIKLKSLWFVLISPVFGGDILMPSDLKWHYAAELPSKNWQSADFDA